MEGLKLHIILAKMRNNNRIFCIIWCATLLWSCKTPEPVSDPEPRDDIELVKMRLTESVGAIVNPIISETASINAKTEKVLEQNGQAAKEFNNAVEEVLRQLDSGFGKQAKNELINRVKNLTGEQEVVTGEINHLKKTLADVSEFLSPANMSKLQNLYLDQELAAVRKENGGKPLTTADKTRIKRSVEDRILSDISSKSKQILKSNEELNVLFIKQNSIAFELRVIEGNISLKSHIWEINSKSVFETGRSELTQAGIISISEDLNLFFDSLLVKIQDIISKSISDTNHYNITLSAYIDGYADSQGFGHRNASKKKLNLQLSQDRANAIEELTIKTFNAKIKGLTLRNSTFIKPKTSSVGHGEDLPNAGKDKYKKEGEADSKRRITVLQCTFRIE